jgi:CHAD domain-containing protein
MREALASARYANVILGVSRWIAVANTAQPVAEPTVTLTDFTSRTVRWRHKGVLDKARRLVTLSESERHRLRLAAKQLRYAMEFFAPFFPAASVADYLRHLEKIQSTLGAANDAANAMRMLAAVATPAEFAAFSRGWFLGRAGNHLELSRAVFARLRQVPRFWDAKPDRAETCETSAEDGNFPRPI